MEETLGGMGLSASLMVVMVSLNDGDGDTYLQTHRVLYLKGVQLFTYQSCLNKVFFFKKAIYIWSLPLVSDTGFLRHLSFPE